MELYHGSFYRIEHPYYGGGKKNNDYGSGFYCTVSPDMAREWSVDSKRDGYLNRYSLELEGLQQLDLTDGSYHILNWLAILLENRYFNTSTPLAAEARRYILQEFRPEYESADLIIGYRADDSYFSFAQDFINNEISYRQLNEAMHLGKLGVQYMLHTPEAFRHLSFLEAEVVDHDLWYPRKELRDRMARRKYADMNKEKWQKGDIYMLTILEQEIKSHDPRLR